MKENKLKFLFLSLGANSNENIETDLLNSVEEKDHKKVKKFLSPSGKVNSQEQTIRNNNIMNFILNYSGQYSIEEISEIFNLNRRTIVNVLNDIEEIKAIKGKSRKKKFSINQVGEEVNKFKVEELLLEDMKKIYLLIILESVFEGSVLRTRFIEYFLGDKEEDFFGSSEKRKTGEKPKRSYIDSLIRALIDTKKIVEANGKLSISNNILKDIDIEKIKSLNIGLDMEKRINPKNDLYSGIANKIKILFNLREEYLDIESTAILSLYDEEKILFIEEAILKNKYLTFKYKSAAMEKFEKKKFILPLKLKYSSANDSWYLEALEGFGKKQEKKLYKLQSLYDINFTSNYDLIVLAKKDRKKVMISKIYGKRYQMQENLIIDDFVYNEEKNKLLIQCRNENEKQIEFNYEKIAQLDILDKFIKPSLKKQKVKNKDIYVKVQFENERFIERKLLVYKNEHKNCTLEKDDEKIILENRVSDLTEFKVFVNGFGRSAIYLEPKKLIDKCRSDLDVLRERILKDE